jgi:hypothetical protein
VLESITDGFTANFVGIQFTTTAAHAYLDWLEIYYPAGGCG